MKPVYLFACTIADAEAKKRMEQVIDIVEIDAKTPEELLPHLEGKEGLIVPWTQNMLITREVLEAGKSLKLVGTTYGGVKQNVDAEAAFERGLAVLHTGASRPRPMAEYTLGLVLSSLLQIHNYHHYMRSGEAWPRNKYPRTRIIQNRKVAVIGVGHIGRGIVDMFKLFTDDIAVVSRHLSDADAAVMGVTKKSLEAAMAESEIIILAGGYTPETHHMIGAKEFALMQENALLVNIARGGMIDQQAMIEAVNSKNIFLALDVFEKEPLEEDSPLRENDRVLMTPHRANNSIEFEQRWQCLAEEINDFYNGKSPASLLTPVRSRVMSDS
ncbi:MAG: glyoxylate reductase [Lentisphaeria bacterium]|nr:glyoxylate reductase [Lentisphaeria bacterium]